MGTVELLAALLVVSNVLWGWHTHKLINKLMSRSFIEYQEAEKILKPKEKEKKNLEFNVSEFEDFGSISEVMPS